MKKLKNKNVNIKTVQTFNQFKGICLNSIESNGLLTKVNVRKAKHVLAVFASSRFSMMPYAFRPFSVSVNAAVT